MSILYYILFSNISSQLNKLPTHQNYFIFDKFKEITLNLYIFSRGFINVMGVLNDSTTLGSVCRGVDWDKIQRKTCNTFGLVTSSRQDIEYHGARSRPDLGLGCFFTITRNSEDKL